VAVPDGNTVGLPFDGPYVSFTHDGPIVAAFANKKRDRFTLVVGNESNVITPENLIYPTRRRVKLVQLFLQLCIHAHIHKKLDARYCVSQPRINDVMRQENDILPTTGSFF
jgi:hypothetical protein